MALDLDRGETAGELQGLMRGASILVDDRLWIVTEDGEAVRMAVEGRGFRIESRFRITPKPVRDCWAHPVLLDGRLYLRYHDTLTCHDAAAR